MKNKLLILSLVVVLFISGCVTQKPAKDATSDSLADDNDVSNSVVIIKKKDNASDTDGGANKSTNGVAKPNNNTASTNSNSSSNTNSNRDGLDFDPYAIDNYPTISIQADPSNPYVDETFLLTITAEDDNGLYALYWEASDGQTASFDCTSQKTCSGIWEFTMVLEGVYTVTAYTVDISGHESGRVSVDVNAQPSRGGGSTIPTTSSCTDSDGGLTYDQKGTTTVGGGTSTDYCSGNNVVEYYCYGSNQDYSTYYCENGCFDGACEAASAPPVDDGSCTYDSQCGSEQICSGGACIDVECRTSSDCSGCKKCSYNTCVNCGYGPYGCTC